MAMQKKKKVLGISCLFLVLSLLITLFWGSGVWHIDAISDEVTYIIGVSQANMRDPWRIALIDELKKETEKHENVRLIITDATSNVEKQKSDIDSLQKCGMDLLIVSPCDTRAMTEKVKEVYDRDIPVIVMDRAIEGFDYTLYLGPDNERIGKQAGEYIVGLLEEKQGTVLKLGGTDMPIQSEERCAGFESVMEEYSGIDIRELRIENELKDTVYDAIVAGKDELEDVDAVFAQNDHIALGVYEALRDLGMEKDIAIVGSDGFTGKKEGIGLVMNHKIAATISCSTGGKEAIEYALDILNHESGVPKQVILRSYTITAENAEEYLKNLDAVCEDDGRRIKVGYSQVGQESQWRLANTKSIKESAERFNVELLFDDANQSQKKQIEAVRNFIREKVDVIVISPVVETGWEQVLREAKEAGIPVVMSDRNVELEGVDASDDLLTTYIGADFREEGRRAMRWIRDTVTPDKEKMNIMQLRGTRGASPTVEREQGFREVLEECPRYQIVYSDYGDFTLEGGRRIVREYLESHSWDIDIIYAHNDDMALGAIEELKEHGIRPGVDVKILSVDATKPAFQAMVEGELNCAVECNPILGNQLMKAVRDLVSGKQMPLRIITEEKIYDQKMAEDLINTRLY